MVETKIKITPAKGRPMLHWVGKKPLDYVKGFPAQLVEVFDPSDALSLRGVSLPNGEPISYDNLKDNWQNLLFHGDNKDVLATLLELGFRGKIDLVYIDPPFNTGVDYVRKARLRGLKTEQLEGEWYSPQEQVMYSSNFADDAYLQWMYERLQLLKELLAETGSIFLRMDYRFGHYIKALMDEIFGKDNFVNEISVNRTQKIFIGVKGFNVAFDSLFLYQKSDQMKFRNVGKSRKKEIQWLSMHSPGIRHPREREVFGRIFIPPEGRHWTFTQERIDKELIPQGRIRISPSNPEILEYLQSTKELLDSDWSDIPGYTINNTGYPTENSEQLLERIILTGSDPRDLVLDCFVGSGTTAAVAQRLGRRWIACDINKGAVQTTSKRLQKIILEQMSLRGGEASEAISLGIASLPAVARNDRKHYSFAVYKVNDYDLQLLRTEAIELAVQHIGIQRMRTDAFFDGYLGKNLVKIIDFNHPLTLLDLQLLKDELKKRPDEGRDITVVSLGKELAVDPWIEDWNKKHPVNRIKVIELKTDKKYGTFLIHKPAEARIKILRGVYPERDSSVASLPQNDNKRRVQNDRLAIIEIEDFISPTIIERLNIDSKLFKVKIPDFRCMIDTVLIDNNYDGKTFHIVYSDVPERKDDLIKGKYEIEVPKAKTKIAVKIIDMLGEEVIVVKEV